MLTIRGKFIIQRIIYLILSEATDTSRWKSVWTINQKLLKVITQRTNRQNWIWKRRTWGWREHSGKPYSISDEKPRSPIVNTRGHSITCSTTTAAPSGLEWPCSLLVEARWWENKKKRKISYECFFFSDLIIHSKSRYLVEFAYFWDTEESRRCVSSNEKRIVSNGPRSSDVTLRATLLHLFIQPAVS